MAIAIRQKKWFKVLLSIIILLTLIAGVLFYLLNYRVRDILQAVVNKESNGVYGFDATAVEVSFVNKSIVIKNALLFCRDTVHTSPHYEVKIPALYFAIQSWKEVLFQKKVSVDSLCVLDPEIKLHDHLTQKAHAASFHVSGITEKLAKLLTQLQVRSFHLENGSFVFSQAGNPVPLAGNHINFSVSNFSKKANGTDRLFSSDDIDLSMNAQHWVLPDGKHDISFKHLHFSGRNQFFELDSCTFNAVAAADKGKMALSAEKLFFNSKQLAAMYQKDELLIDTLICYHPVLKLETANKDIKQADSSASVSKAISQVFTNIRFNYIDVKDGELSIINKYRPNYTTQKANFQAYNLHIGRNNDPAISTDSILLNLKNLQFLTTDSLFQLTVADFTLKNNDVLFSNAVYEPTARNQAEKGFTFKAPLLHLKNIDLAALMNKKITAGKAELRRPVITVYDHTKTHGGAVAQSPSVKKKSFYQTLHGLNELISVKHFNIIHGSLGYQSSGSSQMKLSMNNLNAGILLNKLFLSDSLIDIKRSLPELTTGEVFVQSPKLSLRVSNYNFKGERRHNSAEKFQLQLANGISILGKQLYWEIFDWDMYANHKIIQVEYLKLQNLAISIIKKVATGAASTQNNRDLPALHIARFNLDNLQFSDSSAKNTMRFDASDICFDNIGSSKKFFTWNNAEVLVRNFLFKNSHAATVSAGNININTQNGTEVQHIKIDIKKENGYTKVYLPLTKIATDIHSTDFSSISLPLLEADNADIEILKKQSVANGTLPSKPIVVPLAVKTGRLVINKAIIKYTSETTRDTLTLTARIGIDATGINGFKKQQQLFNYDKMMVALSDLKADKGRLNVCIPQSALVFTAGMAAKNNTGSVTLTSGIEAVWNRAAIQLQQTDTTGFDASLSGSFNDADFRFSQGTKLNWQSLISKTTISKGSGQYKGKNITANAGSIAWHPKESKLSVRSFFLVPNLNMQQTFTKAGAWQGDYMTINGEAMDISGIRYQRHEGDSLLSVKKLLLDSISLTTTRDKRMPFRHGIEKAMPVALINSLKMPLRIDSVLVTRSKVTVNEIAIKSEKQGTIPLSDINAVITNFKNRNNANDSLTMVANARLLNYKISDFFYKEAYGDSLSYFLADVHVSQMALPAFSAVTIPLASVSVANGNADTLFARWTGNKYAAVGRMDFYYQGLKIRLLDAKDNTKKKFLLSLGNMVAGLILNKNNDETSRMFFVRDREKFIFNYWVKTMLAGLSTSAGIKRNKKMIKKYQSLKTRYSMPVLYD